MKPKTPKNPKGAGAPKRECTKPIFIRVPIVDHTELDKHCRQLVSYFYDVLQKEHEEKIHWFPVSDPPKKAELIILEYSGCLNSKKYVIYDFDPEYFEGVFHINGVADRWRSFL